MDDLDDVVKRYTEECVSLLAESVQKHLKDLQEENAKLKAENEKLTRENALFKLSMQSYQTSACSLDNLSTLTFQATSNIISPFNCTQNLRRF